MTRPGDRVRAVASRLFGEQAMERVIDPIVADMQCEYDEALVRGAIWRGRVSLIRSYCGLGQAVFWLAVRTASHRDSLRSDIARTCIVSAIASAIVTVALVIPPLLNWFRWQGDAGFTALVALSFVPQALPLSIPAGLCVAVLWAMRARIVTWRRLGAVLAISLACTALVWVVLEWMMPQANLGFREREMVAARLSDGPAVTLEPGLNELGLSRLGQRSDPAAVRHYQTLWALCFASAPLSLVACGLARYVRRAVSAVALAMALSQTYLVILWACAGSTTGRTMPASVSAWTPNVVFIVIGCALLVRAQRPGVPSSAGSA